ncbi:MAG: Hsp20/alpha crystallin family protein [bacterium]|nr:Hsp20/alpha crystallin family protein [bacterium]
MAENTVEKVDRELAAKAAGQPSAIREETSYMIPPVDIFETEEGLTVVADMPGITRDHLTVRVDNGILTIEGKVDRRTSGDNIYSEFALLDHFRQFQLSEQVDQEKIKAELKHGVLTVHLPKVEAARPRQITVKVA